MPKKIEYEEGVVEPSRMLPDEDVFAILDALKDGSGKAPQELAEEGQELLEWCLESLVDAQIVLGLIEGWLLARKHDGGWEFRRRTPKGVN